MIITITFFFSAKASSHFFLLSKFMFTFFSSQQIHVHKRRWTHEDLLLRQGSHRFLDFKLESSMWMKLMIKSSMWMKPMIKSSMCIKLMITINVETFRYRRGCRVQGPRKEQVVKVQKRLIFTIIGHDDGNHCNHLGVVMVKPLERNMFVQIFEHILHGTSIQMEQRNNS